MIPVQVERRKELRIPRHWTLPWRCDRGYNSREALVGENRVSLGEEDFDRGGCKNTAIFISLPYPFLQSLG